MTKVPPEATVSNVVALQETSRSIETFSMAYDRLFAEFQETLVREYANTRVTYIGEY